jgi:hypothetical protein
MPRRVEDIIPANQKSIRNIPLSRSQVVSKKSERDVARDDETIETKNRSAVSSEHNHVITEKKRKTKHGNKRWFFLTIGIIVISAGLGYVASIYFARASFTITPKSASFNINSTFSAQSAKSDTGILFEMVKFNKSATTSVVSSMGPVVSTKASGEITIFNSYSTTTQKLVAGTRFANDGGKLYRLSGTVIVPGYKVTASKVVIPGSIKATLIADQVGSSYNITSKDTISDFKIVAYKGTTKYSTIYARQNGEISGGYSGATYIVSSTTLSKAVESLKNTALSKSLAEAKTMVGSDKVIYDAVYTISSSKPVTTGVNASTSIVSLNSTVSIPFFNKKSLVSILIATSTTSIFGKASYTANGLDKLSVQLSGVKDATNLSLKIKGTVTLSADIDVDALKNKLRGLYSSDAKALFNSMNDSILSVEGEVMPPWSMIPYDTAKTLISVKN